MFPRAAESLVLELLAGFPIVTVTGPRQSGKTTLARKVLGDRPYRSLEDPGVREPGLDDRRGFGYPYFLIDFVVILVSVIAMQKCIP